MDFRLAIARARRSRQRHEKSLETRDADDLPGVAVSLAGISPAAGNPVKPERPFGQRTCSIGAHAPGRVVVEPAEPDGHSADFRDGCRLQYFHAARLAPLSWPRARGASGGR